jgi:hypothetical protein
MSKAPLHTPRAAAPQAALGDLEDGRGYFRPGPLPVAGGVPLSCPIFAAVVGASAPKGAPLASSAPPRRSAAVLGCVSHTTTTTLKEGST